MSTWYPYRFSCPDCGAPNELQLLKGIHIRRLPQVRAALLAGTLTQTTCTCGRTLRVEAPTVYTDFASGQYIAVERPWPTDVADARKRQREVFDRCFTLGPDVAQQLGGELQTRLVFGMLALREKVLAWDAALDDRILEVLKAQLISEADLDPRRVVLRLAEVLEGGHLLFTRLEPPTQRAGVPLPPPAGGALREGSPLPPAGEVAVHQVGATGLGWVTAPRRRYEQALMQRTRGLEGLPWLGDPWLVDLYDGAS